jgi:hypothetical protein
VNIQLSKSAAIEAGVSADLMEAHATATDTARNRLTINSFLIDFADITPAVSATLLR